MSKLLSIVAAVMAVYAAIAYGIATLMHLKGGDFWVLFGGLIAIGLLASGAYLWFEKRKQDAEKRAENPQQDAGGVMDDLAQILREAEHKLAASQLGPNARYSSLPAIFVVGPAGSAKTTAVVHSGLDPELLAGQVFRDNSIGPTRFANLWYARQTVFIEAADAVLGDAGKWVGLIRRMRPAKLSAVRKGEQAPRAAVVCFSCETFLQAGSTEAVASAARQLHGKLNEISRQLGIALPVYVLFTKADRISFFLDYVHALTNDEVGQVLGATLPLTAGPSQGVYADEQTSRLAGAFDNLYLSLCNKRLEFLPRENDPERLPGAYEFPRELGKARDAIVQFLVDVCRPSELSAAPFLRGFYFCGVRPIFVREALAAPARRQGPEPFQPSSGATGIFRLGQGAPQQASAAEVTEVRKAPQWVFLNHFFSSVLLADHAALGSSVTSVKTNALRRFLLTAAGALCLLYLVFATISFFKNSGLIAEVRTAVAGIARMSSQAGAVPDIVSLRQLDNLRIALEKVARYNNQGAPLNFRWGLYAGRPLYDEAKALYFDRFSKLLFGSTEAGLRDAINGLPGSPPGGADAPVGLVTAACSASNGPAAAVAPIDPHTTFGYVYDTLKAYLITTSNPEHASSDLTPVLFARWSEGKSGVNDETAQLVKNQFNFYTYALENHDNPYPELKHDDDSVAKGRRYLSLFSGIGPVYHWMLSDASLGGQSARFQQQVPGKQVVFDSHEVPAAYTKAGWAKMQDELKHIDKYTKAGGDWVMGTQTVAGPDPGSVQSAVSNRYRSDYIAQWHQYLCQAHVAGYTSLKDAADKLAVLKRPDSPLLAALCLESQNTDAPELASEFTAVHSVVAPACAGNLIGPGNTDYMTGLGNLQFDLSQVKDASEPNDPNMAAANAHRQATRNLVDVAMFQKFGLDPQASVVQSLLDKPLEVPLPTPGRLLDAKIRKELCPQLRVLMNQYPFNPNGPPATLDDINRILNPNGGALWAFYNQSLTSLMQKSGSQYTAIPANGVTLTPAFVGLFNSAAALSSKLYANNSPTPQIRYSVMPIQTDISQSAQLTIDGQPISFTGTPTATQLTWPGTQQGVSGTAKGLPWDNEPGLWGVFRFFGLCTKPGSPCRQLGPGKYEWHLRGGVTNQAEIGTLVLAVEPPDFPPRFSNLTCPAVIAK